MDEILNPFIDVTSGNREKPSSPTKRMSRDAFNQLSPHPD